MVRQWQQLFFDKRYASTEMINPVLLQYQGYFVNLARSLKEIN